MHETWTSAYSGWGSTWGDLNADPIAAADQIATVMEAIASRLESYVGEIPIWTNGCVEPFEQEIYTEGSTEPTFHTPERMTALRSVRGILNELTSQARNLRSNGFKDGELPDHLARYIRYFVTGDVSLKGQGTGTGIRDLANCVCVMSPPGTDQRPALNQYRVAEGYIGDVPMSGSVPNCRTNPFVRLWGLQSLIPASWATLGDPLGPEHPQEGPWKWIMSSAGTPVLDVKLSDFIATRTLPSLADERADWEASAESAAERAAQREADEGDLPPVITGDRQVLIPSSTGEGGIALDKKYLWAIAIGLGLVIAVGTTVGVRKRRRRRSHYA